MRENITVKDLNNILKSKVRDIRETFRDEDYISYVDASNGTYFIHNLSTKSVKVIPVGRA